MTVRIFPFITVLAFLFINCQSPKNMIDKTTVQHLDIERYMGTWYEIARLPNRFEKDLIGVTATYKLRDDGKLKVINAGYKNTFDGKFKEATGKAKIPNPEEPGKLKVSFFLFFYSEYNILELDDDYQHALVGSSTPKYLWILSRTPQLEENTYDMLVQQAQARGYDTSELIKVKQKKE